MLIYKYLFKVEGYREQLEGFAMYESTWISSKLEEPFDFGNCKSVSGEYVLHLEDGSAVRIILYPSQSSSLPYAKFEFYVDYITVASMFGGELKRVGTDVPGSGPIVLDRFLPAGSPILGPLKLTAVSYEVRTS